MTYNFDPGVMAGITSKMTVAYLEARQQGAKPGDYYLGLLMMLRFFEESFAGAIDLKEIKEAAESQATEVLRLASEMLK